MYKNLVAAFAAACCLSPTFAQSSPPPSQPVAPPVKAAWVYVSPITEAGWTRQHDDARRAVERALGPQVQTTFVENVPEGADAERVIRDLAAQGHHIIFTPSFGYMEPTLAVARDFPQVRFESITGYKQAPNVATANARHYEGRYLAGVAAGRMTKTGVAGYVAGFPIPEVLQGINAFTLGARSVDPQAQVRVIWLNEWFNPARERDAAMLLMDQGADVLAFHTGSTAVPVAAQERGKYVVAYHSDMRQFAPTAQIMAVTHHWGDYETGRIRALIAPSFADIFFNNCFKNGLLPIVLPESVVAKLFDEVAAFPGYQLTIDLEQQKILKPDGAAIDFDVQPFRKYCLLGGLDDIGLTLRHKDAIAAFEAQRLASKPWLAHTLTTGAAA